MLLDHLGREISRANRIGFHARDSAFVLVREHTEGIELVDLIGSERVAVPKHELYELKEKHVHYRNNSHQ